MTLVSLLFFVNTINAQNNLRVGYWQGNLELNDSTQLPFNFEVKYDVGFYTIDFINAEERISTTEIAIQKDSVFIRMPVFDSEFRCVIKGDSLKGFWINHSRKDKKILLFKAIINPYYFNGGTSESWAKIPEGWKYEVTFSPDSPDSSKAIGLFKGNGQQIRGTFLTETGDYRFLFGYTAGLGSRPAGEGPRRIVLSCFDGSHAFLFVGIMNDKGDRITNGHFYSGSHHHEPWVAKRNEQFKLAEPESLTYLKPGYSKVDFSFKNTEGKIISLQDEKFKNKVVIIQLMGTWCPNCMDETAFLAPFYDAYKNSGLEVVALAFERTTDYNKAVENINRSKKKFNAGYEFLITGLPGKDQASAALPMLNKVMAFPTTIYIDKKGVVRKIYTGFSGPATGAAYNQFAEETKQFTEKLLAE